ncbi:MAG TPA: alpha/beta hydrolase [Acidimicrobiales bacterium]|jgi:acetyl esterase/lipase
MQWLVLISGLIAVSFVANAFAPRHGPRSVVPGFFASWLTIELAGHWLVLVVIIGLLGATGVGGADIGDPVTLLGLILLGAAGIGLAVLAVEGWRARQQMTAALADLDVDPKTPLTIGGRFPRGHVVLPFLVQQRRGVRRVRDIVYTRVAGRELRLDLTLPAAAMPGERRPVVLQIHGGGWIIGYKRQQGQPLLNHLATRGWIGVNIDYRLSPGATFPDHLVDCKRALAWIRGHIADFGGDADTVCVTGGSAGGHLAALVGLTANQSRYQPGFEDVDTSVRAAVPFYGAYDMTNRLGTARPQSFRKLLEPLVIKAFLEDDPAPFSAASPVDHVHPAAPPFLVLHGDRDVITPVDDARLFVQALRDVSQQPVLYAELSGAQHAFDIFPSVRTAAAVEAVEQFLSAIWRRHQAAVGGELVGDFAAAVDLAATALEPDEEVDEEPEDDITDLPA